MRSKRRAPSGRRRRSISAIGRAHAAQVVHQRERRVVAHGQPVDIGDRQRKARALQQRAQLAQIGERRNPRRDAALDLGLGLREGLAQLGQRVAAEQRRQEQAVRLERAADLHQRARQVVDELQRQRRDDEIERAVANGSASSSATTRSVDRPAAATAGSPAIDADLAACRQRAAHRVGRRAEIDRTLEPAQHRRQPVGEILRDAVDQEGRRPERAARAPARRSCDRTERGRTCVGLVRHLT